MGDFETEAEASAYFQGQDDGRAQTIVSAIDGILDLVPWADRVSILNYLQTKIPPEGQKPI